MKNMKMAMRTIHEHLITVELKQPTMDSTELGTVKESNLCKIVKHHHNLFNVFFLSSCIFSICELD